MIDSNNNSHCFVVSVVDHCSFFALLTLLLIFKVLFED